MPQHTKPRARAPVAETTRAFADAFPKHPSQDAFLAAAITLCAADVTVQRNGATPEPSENALAVVRAEYVSALEAMIFLPDEARFYCIWSAVQNASYLAAFLTVAWHDGPGTYGEKPPQHWVRNPSSQARCKPKRSK